MSLLKNGEIVADPWTALPEGAAPEGDVIVSLEQWQADRETLRAHNGRLGLRLKSDQSPADLAGDLDRFDLIALEFPRFGDGRAYSYARLLRERYGFTGELRAVGNVLRDQLLFMLRCGFDAFEIDGKASGQDAVAAWQDAVTEIAVFYQPTGDGRRTASALRRGVGNVENGKAAAGTGEA
ncbi:MAG: DUF934 domain-containing protein [Kiloniellaceae bacterium]